MTDTSYLQAWKSAIALDDASHAATLLRDPRAEGWGPQAVGGTDGSLLVRAAGEGAAQVVRLLMPLSALNQQDSDGLTALMRAAKGNHVEVLQALLDNLVPGASAQNGPPTAAPLRQALNLFLLDHENHRTALHWAAAEGHVKALNVLLPHIPALTPSGMNTLALHDAADDGTMTVVDALLPFGGTNHQDDAGWTPIMYAAINGRSRVVHRLASLTDLTLRNHEGQSALDIARQRGVAVNVQRLEIATQQQEAAVLRKAMDGVLTAPVEPSTPRVRL